jgi:hypothetical protein
MGHTKKKYFKKQKHFIIAKSRSRHSENLVKSWQINRIRYLAKLVMTGIESLSVSFLYYLCKYKCLPACLPVCLFSIIPLKVQMPACLPVCLSVSFLFYL